jgi:hypothetical protein
MLPHHRTDGVRDDGLGKGYREFIADLASERRSLHESEMMPI